MDGRPDGPPGAVGRAVALRRLIARALLPRSFRDARGGEMEAAFLPVADEAWRRGGRRALAWAVGREAVDLVRAGLSLRVRALERHADTWTGEVGEMLKSLASGALRDARLATRSLVRRPAWGVLTVTTLALGVGGGTAMYALVKGVLLDPLGYPEPDRLAHVFLTNPDLGWDRGPISLPVFDEWRRENEVFQSLSAFQLGLRRTVRVAGETRLVQGARVSGEYFRTLGVPPAAGRWIRADEEGGGREPVTVLSWELATELYGTEPAVGRRLELGDEPHTVVGVMPADFSPLHAATRFWVPFPWGPAELERDLSFLTVIGRLRPDVELEAARTAVASLAESMEVADPDGLEGREVRIERREDVVTGHVRQPLLLLLGAVGLLLAIAAANLAGVALARGADRRRELAVRTALGAARLQVLRLLGAEALVVGLVGCALAVPVAFLALEALLAAAPPDLPRRGLVALDPGSLLFGGAVALGLTLAFGTTPALLARGYDPAAGLAGGGRGATSVSRLQRLLVVGQVSIALVLLTGAGLFVTSLLSLSRVDRGFDGDGVLTFRLHPASGAYEEPAELDAMYDRVVEGLRGLPGVDAVGATWALPFGESFGSSEYMLEDRPDTETHLLQLIPVRGDYFGAMGITPVRGRLFRPGDGADGALVTIVNETFAERAWPGRDPVGRRLRKGTGEDAVHMEVIGVVPDVALTALGEAPSLQSFWPHVSVSWARELYFTVRTDGDPFALVPGVRAVVSRIDERLPITDVRTMSGRLAEELAPFRFRGVVVGAFAALASLLVLIGVYGVTALLVTRRRREMGIRMALGADRRSLLADVLGEGGRLALGGVAVGLLGATLAARTVEGVLYGVEPLEPGVYLTASAAVVLVALVAAWVPARRAGRTDPLEALRAE